MINTGRTQLSTSGATVVAEPTLRCHNGIGNSVVSFISLMETMAYLSLGSNVGDREANLRNAIARLGEWGDWKRCLLSTIQSPSKWSTSHGS